MKISRIVFLLFLVVSIASCKNKEQKKEFQTQDSFEKETQKRLVDIKIEVKHPQPGEEITSPYIITGKARGNWYFEGDFPIFLVDEANNEIAIAIAKAQEDWMTEEYVNFKAELIFEKPKTKKAFLKFERSNPSGKPEFDEFIKVPVTIKAGEMFIDE